MFKFYFLSVLIFAGCTFAMSAAPDDEGFSEQLMTKTFRVGVDGMVCSFCAQGIVEALKANPEVESVNVLMDDAEVEIIIKDGASMELRKVKQAIEFAGYTFKPLSKN